MTSTTSNQSDSGCPDKNDPKDQAECPELQIQPSFATNGIAHLGISSPNVHFPTTPQLVATHAMAPATYPYPDPYYRSIFAPYDAQPYATHPFGAQPMVHLQLMGIQQAGIPLPSDAVEEPVFVNAKQYHGILRRRQSRAKAESEKKVIKSKKPYLHESRHLHALRRARGDGGRFLNSKKSENEQKEAASSDKSQSNLNVNFDRNDNASSNGKS